MLFKKTLKVASATALWMVALFGANSAMAQAPLPHEKTFSAEALTRIAAGDFNVEAAGFSAPMTADTRLRYHLTTEAMVHLRVEPSGVLKFGDDATAPRVLVQTTTVRLPTERTIADQDQVDGDWLPIFARTQVDQLAQGIEGTRTGDKSAYRFPIPAQTIDNDDVEHVRLLVFLPGDTGTVATASATKVGTAGVTVAAYSKEADAEFGEGTSYQTMSTTLFAVASSVMVASATPTPIEHTASAADNFRQLTEGGPTVALGGFHVTVDHRHLKPDGTALGTAEMQDPLFSAVGIDLMKSSSKFYGEDDQGFAYASKFALNSLETCRGVPPEAGKTGISSYPGMEVDEGEDEPDANVVMGGVKPAPWFLCVTIDEDNDELIPKGNILMDVMLAADDELRLVSPSMASREGIHVGTIDQDGTTVQIPFLSSYEPYTQRLVVVNRSKHDSDFTLEFRAEGVGTIEPSGSAVAQLTHDKGMIYSGTAEGGKTTVIKIADEVTMINPTRASATLVFPTPKGLIDVATTTVNKADGSTDTVVLDSR